MRHSQGRKSRILPKIRLQVGFWAYLTPGIVSAVNFTCPRCPHLPYFPLNQNSKKFPRSRQGQKWAWPVWVVPRVKNLDQGKISFLTHLGSKITGAPTFPMLCRVKWHNLPDYRPTVPSTLTVNVF